MYKISALKTTKSCSQSIVVLNDSLNMPPQLFKEDWLAPKFQEDQLKEADGGQL